MLAFLARGSTCKMRAQCDLRVPIRFTQYPDDLLVIVSALLRYHRVFLGVIISRLLRYANSGSDPGGERQCSHRPSCRIMWNGSSPLAKSHARSVWSRLPRLLPPINVQGFTDVRCHPSSGSEQVLSNLRSAAGSPEAKPVAWTKTVLSRILGAQGHLF